MCQSKLTLHVFILALCASPQSVSAQCMEAMEEDGIFTLGSIDENLAVRKYNNRGTGHGLHTDTPGLFLLPAPIGTKGRVSEVCAFGYPRIEDELKLEDETGNFDLYARLRLFLYIVLYRPISKTQALNPIAYNPIVVYHDLDPGCISQDDGLNWRVKEGDLLGVLIPDACTTPEKLLSRDDVETFNEEELMELEVMNFEFCPSQIDLNATAHECHYALYLNSTDLDEIKSVDFEEINANASVRLNIRVKIKEVNVSNQAAVIGISVAVTLLMILIALASVITLCILIIRTKKGRRSATEENPYYSSINDLVEPVTNIGWIGVNTKKNCAYGTRAVMDHEESADTISLEGVKAGSKKSNDYNVAADQTTVTVQHSFTQSVDLDEDGYVDAVHS